MTMIKMTLLKVVAAAGNSRLAAFAAALGTSLALIQYEGWPSRRTWRGQACCHFY